MVARYLIFKESSSIVTVHILNFADSNIKELFFKEYGFDSVPVIKLSEIIADAKIWNNSHRISRSYSGGGGSRKLSYIDITSGKVVEAEVPLSEIEEGGFFVYIGKIHRNRIKIKMANNYGTTYPESIVRDIEVLSNAMDADINRVYIIGTLTANSKWFSEAVKSGDWINLWQHLQENISQIEHFDKLRLIADLNNNRILSKKATEYIEPLIIEKKSPIIDLIQKYKEVDKYDLLSIIEALNSIGLSGIIQNSVGSTFEVLQCQIEKQYPFLPKYTDYNSTEDKMNEAVKYINAMDLFVSFSDNKQETLKEQNEVVA